MTTPETHFDVIVIGGGPGGYAAAIRLAQRGLGVACIEKEAVGGVCLNWGCIPSKALITTAQRFDWARSGAELGVLADNVRLDLPQAQKRNRAIVQHHTDGVAGLLRSNGARLIYGVAELSGPRRVRVRQPDGSDIELSAERALLLATGARPRSLPGFEPDGERILTAREAIFLERLPEHLIVVGGGVIGVELGGAYQRLGSQLTVLELGKSLLPGVDPDLVRLVHQRFTAQTPGQRAATIQTEARVLGWEPSAQGVRVRFADPSGEHRVDGSQLLVATGFLPNTGGLGLEQLGVALDARGHVQIDERCETNVPGVYAIGDVAGPPYLAHKAYKEAEVVTEVILGKRVVRDWRALPAVIFGDPRSRRAGPRSSRAPLESPPQG